MKMKQQSSARQRNSSRRRLFIQSLERRNLLAGDVLAIVDDGDLIIDGDADGNQIEVDQAGLAAGEFRISGLDGTTINGDAGPVVIGGVSDDVKIDLGDGDDSVVLDEVTIADDLKIDMGDGLYQIALRVDVGGDVDISSGDSDSNEFFEFQALSIVNSTIGDDLTVKHKDGVDQAQFVSTTVGGDVKIDNGDGGVVGLGGEENALIGGLVNANNLEVGGDLEIKNKDGLDQNQLGNLSIGGDLKLDYGDGGFYVIDVDGEPTESLLGGLTYMGNVDVAGDVDIKNKDGFDLLQMSQVNIGDDLKVDNGKGGINEIGFFFGEDDGSFTQLNDVTIGDDFDFKSKDGSDFIQLDSVIVEDKAKIKTGDDDDEVRVTDSVFAEFSADGGKGEDLFEDGGGNDFGGAAQLKKFEIVIEDDDDDEEPELT